MADVEGCVPVPLLPGRRSVGASVRRALGEVELSGSAALLAPVLERLGDAVDAAARVDVDLMLEAVERYVELVDRLGLDAAAVVPGRSAPVERSAAERVAAAGEAGPR